MTPETAEHEIRARLETVSGRPVFQRAQAPAQGYAVLRLADATAPAHLLLYRPELAADLPYLAAFQYGLALRTLEAAPDRRFDLGPTPAMATEVRQLITDHLHQSPSSLPASVIPELSQQLGSGLGLQLRSMPIAIRVDDWLWQDYPALSDLQRRNVQRQLQENMQALSPNVRAFAPESIIAANAAMSCAYAKFWAETWSQPDLAIPFIAAGYGKIADDLLALVRSIDTCPDGDRELVDQWAQRLGLDHWFQTIDKP